MPEEVAKRGPGRPPLGGPGAGPTPFVMIRMTKDQKQQMEQAAAAADLSASEILRLALEEKLARDEEMKTAVPEMLAEARKMKPQGVSRAAWNAIVRDQIAKIGNPKKTLMMFTSEQDARRILMEEAATWHAEAAGAPETAPQLLQQYCLRYKRDPTFRKEIDAGARESLARAERLKRRTLPLGSSKAQQ
jgi:hypothetical protein